MIFEWKSNYNGELKANDDFIEISIDNNDKKISGWLKINSSINEPSPLVIYYGGNAQNTSNLCAKFENDDKFKYFDGYNFLTVDYPGYGLSEGETSDKTMFETALKVYDYACSLEYVDKDNIVIVGYSIGSGVATYVASQRDVNGLVLVAPYDEALSLYNDFCNIFYGPMKLLMRYHFKSNEYAKSVKVRPMIFTSYDDEVINYKLSLNLSNCFDKKHEIVVLNDGTNHNGYFDNEQVLDGIEEYLQERIKE